MHEASDGRDGVPADVSMRAVKLDFHCRTTSGARLFSTQARTASTSSLLACCLLMVSLQQTSLAFNTIGHRACPGTSVRIGFD